MTECDYYQNDQFSLRHLMEACGLNPDDTAARSKFVRDEKKFRPDGHSRKMTAYDCLFIALQYELYKMGISGEHVAALSLNGLDPEDHVLNGFLVCMIDKNSVIGNLSIKWGLVTALWRQDAVFSHLHAIRLWPILHAICSRVEWLPHVPEPPERYPELRISLKKDERDSMIEKLESQIGSMRDAIHESVELLSYWR